LVLAGLLEWLPSLAILIGLPVLALVVTKHVLLPSIKQAYAQEAAMSGEYTASQGATPAFLATVPLNPPGTKRAHYGFRSLGLFGTDSAFKNRVDQNMALLKNLANSDLKGKTVFDLEKPGVLDALRSQLLADFNRALGGPVVKELYIAVWPAR
jgi:hypothetical protein